jgi:hypothetical protein
MSHECKGRKNSYSCIPISSYRIVYSDNFYHTKQARQKNYILVQSRPSKLELLEPDKGA